MDGAHQPRYPEDMNALRRMGRDRAAMLAGLLAPLAVASLLTPWRTSMLNTDAAAYGGANLGNGGSVTSADRPAHGRPFSLSLTLPPLSAIWLAP